MRVFKLHAEGYIDPETEFEYKHIMNYREVFPLVHEHDYFEFFFIIEGSIRHVVNQQTFYLEQGHMVFIRPADFHSYHHHQGDCHFINVAILRKTILELFDYLGPGFDSDRLLNAALPPTLLLTRTELNKVVSRFEKLNTLPVYDKKRQNVELRCILINLFSGFFLSRPESNILPDWLNHVVGKMQVPANFRMGTSVIKELACKSDEHISRSFKKYLNQTPTQYVNELRLNYAANQMRFSNMKINDIAYDSGFENLSNFHRQFKRKFNFTPLEFRKANQKYNIDNH